MKTDLNTGMVIFIEPQMYGGPEGQLQNKDSINPWWRHQMETFSGLLALCEGISPVTGEFPSQRLVMQSFDVFFDLCLNKQLSKQS